MAGANESQGLKIAVAAFITLSVILAVACYFLYSAYNAAEARRVAAETQLPGQGNGPSGKTSLSTTGSRPADSPAGRDSPGCDSGIGNLTGRSG